MFDLCFNIHYTFTKTDPKVSLMTVLQVALYGTSLVPMMVPINSRGSYMCCPVINSMMAVMYSERHNYSESRAGPLLHYVL